MRKETYSLERGAFLLSLEHSPIFRINENQNLKVSNDLDQNAREIGALIFSVFSQKNCVKPHASHVFSCKT